MEWNLRRPVSRVSGPSFMLHACEYGVARQWRHFFLGGGDGVVQKLADNLKSKNPGMIVAGCYTPPFRDLTEEEELQVKTMIENSHADLLWVGLGGPKQEFWMKKHLNNINVPVMLGVGAAFDFHSGRRQWAPRFVRKWGAEWVYRTFCGGRRIFMRNMKAIPLLCFCVLFDYVACLFRPAGKIVARVPGQKNKCN
ncbi:MAG: WecB/TagA/CpsF family glycosyltransferase [Victivallaceae bacterium]|nr:WecB/TagA/CpsF family glycosyltransferase [Victivallaceae bacterium]